MTDGEAEVYRTKNPVRVVTATSLFDGHDAAINIMRRILQATGVEVIHLGHNRSVAEIVDAAIEEDAHAVAVSCYQGGHLEFFKYIVDLLKERGAAHIKVFGGGGGVIVPKEIRELEAYGVAKIYSPEDGARMGLQGMINHLVESIDYPMVEEGAGFDLADLDPQEKGRVARLITAVEAAKAREDGHLVVACDHDLGHTVPYGAPTWAWSRGIRGFRSSRSSALSPPLPTRAPCAVPGPWPWSGRPWWPP